MEPMTGTELLDRIRPTEHRLENGLMLLVREVHVAPVVSIVTHVRAGYFDEPDELVGISHVLEHMFFKGTERRAVGEIARATKAAGGYLNAGTIYDHTSYYTVLPSAAVDMGLDIQADALIHSQIDEEELRKELLVIIEEVKRKYDNPGALATEKLYEAMFDVHPIRRWRMGTEKGLRRLERAQVFDYYRSMYRASNITLVVSGDVDPGRVVDRVEALYAELPPGSPERPERSEPERTGARLREMSGDIAHTYVELGWHSPGELHEDTPALDALGVVLGQGRASRLYRRVRERGLASSVEAYNFTPADIGVFGIGLECKPPGTAAALRAVWTEVDGARETGVHVDELERVRTLLEARLLRRLETAEGQANLLAEWQALGDWRRAGDYLDRLRGLTVDRLRDVADRYLDAERATALVYRPSGTEALGWGDDGFVAGLRDDGSRAATAGAAEPPPEGSGEPIDASAAAPAPTPSTVGSPAIEDGVVQYPMNGGRLVVKRRSHAPLVSMALARRGGVLNETRETAGRTALVMRTSVKGTTSRDAERIARESERLGGSIGASAGADLLSWDLTVPAQHFREGFGLLADVALHPTFPDFEVAQERSMVLADLERLRDDMYRYPLRLMLSAAFGDHPYGRSPDDIAAAVSDVDAEALRSWHAEALAEPWVFVVGDIDPEHAADVVAANVGPLTHPVDVQEPRPSWPASPVFEEARRERAQTALALAFPGPSRSDEDRAAMEVLSNAVSGLGNRLFEELRSRRSLAYTVAAYPLVRRHAGAFVGYIASSRDRGEEAREALLTELLRLRDEPPTEEELERARQYTVGGWQIRTQSNAAQLGELAAALMLGSGLEEIRDFEGRIRGVTRDDVLEATRRWFDADRVVEGMVRGTARER